MVSVQVPAGAQQALCGAWQMVASQTVPAPFQVLAAAHAAWVATVQVPAGAQHAPVGNGHGSAEQDDHSTCQRLVAGQPASTVTVQAPVGAQQAFGAGDRQTVGLHTVATPSQVRGEAHAVCVVTVQRLSLAQQAPGGPQTLAEQFVPTPCQALAEGQFPSVVTVHVPAVAQQAPVVGAGHGLLGKQASLSPRYWPPPLAQLLAVCTWQTPPEEQQAP